MYYRDGFSGKDRSKNKFKIIISFLLILIGGVMVFFALQRSPMKQNNAMNETTHLPEKVIEKSPKILNISNRTMFTGDVYWGRYMNDWAQANPLKTAYPFSRYKEFNRDKFDSWVGDLECPTVPGVSMTSAEEDSTLSFNCNPAYLPQMAKWFDIMSLANNHTDNQGGQSGLDTTRKELDKVKVQYFGHFDPDVLDDACEIVGFPVRVSYDDNQTKKATLPIAMCGYHGVFKIPSRDSLAVMQKYSKYFPVIAYPHSGAEYKPSPDEIKTNLYRSMIDNGADVVLGNHPHWIQNSESYKGHLIIYSMGNFMFDQQYNLDVTRSAAIDLRLKSAKTNDSKSLEQWLELGGSCKKFKDDCLQLAEQKKLPKLDFSWDFGIIGTRNNNHLTHPANSTEQEQILKRLDWSNTSKGLKTPYRAH